MYDLQRRWLCFLYLLCDYLQDDITILYFIGVFDVGSSGNMVAFDGSYWVDQDNSVLNSYNSSQTSWGINSSSIFYGIQLAENSDLYGKYLMTSDSADFTLCEKRPGNFYRSICLMNLLWKNYAHLILLMLRLCEAVKSMLRCSLGEYFKLKDYLLRK